MKNEFLGFFSNYVLICAFIAWFGAQFIKCGAYIIKNHSFSFSVLMSSGGMPSSHSSTVCSMVVATGKLNGTHSVTFALAFVMAFIVMYDAAGVRRAAGEQAKVLNKIVAMTSDNIREMFAPQKKSDIRNLFIRRKNMEKDPEEERKREEGKALLKELLGHTPLEVLAGALLGIAVAMLMPVF